MEISVEVAYKSLNKHGEELCGDKVEIIKTRDSNIIILADGMGSGVKANILATLTSKILGTMLLNGAALEDCVTTIVNTLPVCQVRKVAYSTFSILQIFEDGRAYLVEFDNPSCIFIRKGQMMIMPHLERTISGKMIKEYHFHVSVNDCLVLISDGVVHAGVGKVLNFGWSWDSVAEYTLKICKNTLSAARLASFLSKACDELYMQLPGDDTTVAVTKIIERHEVSLFTGPPEKKSDDSRLVEEFMKGNGIKIVCGGTSANIVARLLHKELTTSLVYNNPDIPPMGHIEGIQLVTEGVLTLNKAVDLLRTYLEGNINEEFFELLDQENGASKVAKILIEESTHVTLYIGKAINQAHQNPKLPFTLNIRHHLVEQMVELLKKMGKEVQVYYY